MSTTRPLLRALHRLYSSPCTTHQQTRHASSSSNKRWVNRQTTDPFRRQAQSEGLVSRAGYKLQEMDQRYKLFERDSIVLDLGCAPGAWTQIVRQRAPKGRVLGVDLIKHVPVAGADAIIGDFLDPAVREEVKAWIEKNSDNRHADGTKKVDVVLSDMMANVSGISVRDHAASMDLCTEALRLAYETLGWGGAFVCKFYQGSEDRVLEKRMRRMFERVKREKPEASRKESKEMYFVGLKRRGEREGEGWPASWEEVEAIDK